MPPFRNPFNRRPAALSGLNPVNDENAPPAGSPSLGKALEERPSYAGSRASSGISITKPKREPDEFKMSVVNDSGVYLPPSPPESRGFWRRTPTSTTTSSHRSVLSENEPFSISRESFDSYRRSFDISARSPVSHPDSAYGRQSLDSYPSLAASTPRTPKSAFSAPPPPQFGGGPARRDLPQTPPPEAVAEEEDIFDDVGLGEADVAAIANGVYPPAGQRQHQAPVKKRGLFARLGDAAMGNGPAPGSSGSGGAGAEGGAGAGAEEPRPGSSHRGFHLPGRKRGQSGQGAELRAMPRAAKDEAEMVA